MVLFVFQLYPVCNFGLGTAQSERVELSIPLVVVDSMVHQLSKVLCKVV